MRTEMFSWKLVSGAPVSAGGLTITPQVRVLQVRFPWGGRWGAFVWNRPVAVLVERNGKQERWVLLGRDVLNALRVLLDGPQRAVEVS